LRDQAHEVAVLPFAGPPVGVAGRRAGDLRADQLDPVVVELLAEAQRLGAALVEAGRDDAGVVAGRADRLAERAVGAGQVDAYVGAAVARQFPDRFNSLPGANSRSWRVRTESSTM
jgi:hypothetical protein